MDSRVGLDRVGAAVDASGGLWSHASLEKSVAVGVRLFGGVDVGVEGVGRGADGQLLRSHWLRCKRQQ